MKLTRGQRRVLEAIRYDPDADLAYSKGGGWWYGDEQTNGKLALSLIRLMLVKDESESEDFQRYTINSSGIRALEGEPPYCDSLGDYHDSIAELLQKD